MQHIDTKNPKKIDIENIENLKEFLKEDWSDYKNNPELLALWADLLYKNNLIKQGKVPDNFTAITHCSSCNYVYVPPALVNNGKALGCPLVLESCKKLTYNKTYPTT